MRLKGENTYVVELGSNGVGQALYEPGCYQIEVELTDDYLSHIFRPQRQLTAPRNFCMPLVQEFKWHIAQPITGTHTIHPMLEWFPSPKSLPLIVQIESLDGQPLVATDVLKSDTETLFVGRLHVPGKATPDELAFRPGEEIGQFVADWPPDAVDRGDYKLEVLLVKDASSEVWVPASKAPLTQSFQRRDTLLTMPWALLALIILAVIVIMAVVFIYRTTGPLFGAVLVFIKER
jgi:hypothetical protein